MKMRAADFTALRAALLALLETYPDAKAQAKAAGFDHLRFRWDAFHAVNPGPALPFRHLYDYLNDSHIDTALRAVLGSDF